MNYSEIPIEIREELFNAYGDYLFKKHFSITGLTRDAAIQAIIRYYKEGSYDNVFLETDKKFGKTPRERISFWRDVMSGNFELYFFTLKPWEELEIEGQKFMI